MSEAEIPKSWIAIPIEDCLLAYPNGKKIRQGWSPQCENFPARSLDDWGVLRTSAIQDGYFVPEENKHLPPTLEPRTHLEVEVGDILITCAGPRSRCGVTCLVRSTRPKLLISGKMYQLRADSEIVDRRLLELYLREPVTRRRIDELKTGINDSGLNLTHDRFKTLEVPLPPLNEQKRIVEKIEELFSELDAGEESLRRARRQLGVYRQSLLKQAFEGKLTAKWREEHPELLETPEQLIERVQLAREVKYAEQLKEWEMSGGGRAKPKAPTPVESISSRKLAELPVLPKGWMWQTIENLVDHGRACAYGVLKPGPHVDSGIPLVRVGDIQNGRVSTAEMKKISPKIASQYRRTELRGKEFLISLVGAIGRTAVAQPELRGANTARAVGVVPLSQAINPDFVEVCFRSPTKLAQMVSQANEVARKTLNLEDVRKATVPLCSLPEQQEIVRLLDEQFSVIEENEREIDAALKRSEALRQSILKKAFTGQLVPQDPSDEPASALLERIRAERGKATESGKKRAATKTRP